MPERPLYCAGALIVDGAGRIFVQRRSADLALFPGAWDIVGGHLEPGEAAIDAMRREVAEETGWTVAEVLAVSGDYRYLGTDGRQRSEVDFLIRVVDPTGPRLEEGSHTEYRWVGQEDLPGLGSEAALDGGLGLRVLGDGFAALRRLPGAVDGPAGPPVDLGPIAFAALVAPAVDRAFVVAMGTAAAHARQPLTDRYGAGTGAVLIEFRTSLAEPGRTVTADQFAAVLRYRDLTALAPAVDRQIAAGRLVRHPDGAVGATEAGREYLADVRRLQAEALPAAWRDPWLAGTVGRVLDAAVREAGPALRAMAPVYEPPDCPPEVVLLNRLGTLRYHRADAHALAWTAAGLDAAAMLALDGGPLRDGIEAETNVRAAGPWAAVTPAERLRLLAGLAALPT